MHESEKYSFISAVFCGSKIRFLKQNTSWQHRPKEEGCFDLLVLIEATCAPASKLFLLQLQGSQK